MTVLTPDTTLLGLLAFRPQHGYELLEYFKTADTLGEVWNLSTSQLYAVLKRLESGGLIEGTLRTSDHAPNRTEYTLTAAGKTALEAWLAEPNPSASIRRVRVEFLSRLFIARLLNYPTILMVARQKRACEQQRQELAVYLETLAPGVGRLAVELVIGQLAAVLDWIDRCEMVPKDEDDNETEP
jgi:DNA-binding PadR family transcriptional regulator